MNLQYKQVCLAMTLVVLCAALSFGFSHVFPQGERWLAGWQLSSIAAPPVESSIMMIEVGRKSPAVCGEGQWDLHVLSSLFLALHQAGVAVIAPMLDVSLPVASECGGLQGFVQLAEVTKSVGFVVYPDSVPSALTQAAIRSGFLQLSIRESGPVGGLTFPAASLSSSPRLPFGIAVASSFNYRGNLPTEDSFLHVPYPIDQDEGFVSPCFTFSDIWHLVRSGNQEKLLRLFQGKAVFLSIESSISLNPSLARAHVALAHGYVTNSWVRSAPLSMTFPITLILGFLGIYFMLGKLSVRRVGFIIGAIILLSSAVVVLAYQWNWIWPLMSMGMTVGLTMSGMGVWKWFQTRSSVQQYIAKREQILRELERDLLGKQHHVGQLAEELAKAQRQSTQSGTVIEGLRIAQNASRSELEIYQAEVQETRRKISHLHEELHDLRQQLPATPAECSPEDLTVDDQALIKECEASQIVTRDPAVLHLFQNLKKAAATQVPILLLGETGTGKEVFAKAAHALSARRQGPFISVNMAAIRAELFEGELFGHVKGAFTGAVGRTGFLESAHGGTIFLDEVGDLPLDLQAKLLRFLEDGGFHRVGQSTVTHVDVRILAATNRDLQDEVRAGRYREDLYYRLRSIVLTLPPLRARNQADHVLLAQSFLQQCVQSQHQTDLAFTQGALDAIVAHPWPGNIRELRQTVAQAVALASGSVITEAELHIDEERTPGGQGHWVKDDLGHREDDMVLKCLRRHQFEMQATAATLGWDRGTVTQRLKGMGFQALMEYQGDVHAAAAALAGDQRFVRILEGRLREYSNNLVPSSKNYHSVEEAIADCRKRFRNLPERHFPAVEQLLHQRFAAS